MIKRTYDLWHGEIVVAIHCMESEFGNFIGFINSYQFNNRLKFVVFLVETNEMNANTFPMNYLRNIAVDYVRTSNYLVLDMDEWISPSLESEINKIPLKLLEHEKNAIVIPLMIMDTFRVSSYCCSLEECIEM